MGAVLFGGLVANLMKGKMLCLFVIKGGGGASN